MSVPVTGGRADVEADERRDGDARGEGADGSGDGNGLFGEVDGSHGGKEGVELDVGSDELKRGAEFSSRRPPLLPFPPASACLIRSFPLGMLGFEPESRADGFDSPLASHPKRIHSAACPRTSMVSNSKGMVVHHAVYEQRNLVYIVQYFSVPRASLYHLSRVVV